MQAMFNHADLIFNSMLVSTPRNYYAYHVYIETLLNYGDAEKDLHLKLFVWHDHTCTTEGQMDHTDGANSGLVSRQSFLNHEKSIDLTGHVCSDVFDQAKLLFNGVEVNVHLVRPRDIFSLIDPSGNLSVHVEEANV